jgi:hypothetical protein
MNSNNFKKYLLLLALTLPTLAIAQLDIAEPEYTGNVVYIDNGKARPLEKQKVVTKAKAGASVYIVGVGKVKASNVVNGSRSPVRVIGRDSISLIIRVADNSVDPFQVVSIFQLEQNANKNNRSIEVSSAGTFTGTTHNDISLIPFEAKKYGEKSYLITLLNVLAPGEYALTIEGSRDLFNMFGVD